MKKAKVLENLTKLLARLEREDISTPEEDRALAKVIRKTERQQKEIKQAKIHQNDVEAELEGYKAECDRLSLALKEATDSNTELTHLEMIHAPEHPEHTRGDWIEEVAANNTIIGYWEWLLHRLEEA